MNPFEMYGQGFFTNPEQAAIYFNSLYHYDMVPNNFNNLPQIPFLPFIQEYALAKSNEGPTEDKQEDPPIEKQTKKKVQPKPAAPQKTKPRQQMEKDDSGSNYSECLSKHPRSQPKPEKPKKKKRNTKKNTECNIVNNILSYVCSELKSSRQLSQILEEPHLKKIFYIFLQNIKKAFPKYLNRSNLKALCEIQPLSTEEKVLKKSVKRLEQLPIHNLRVVLRKLVFNYIRGPNSLLPLLTSNKIKLQSKKHHIWRREQLKHFVEHELQDYNQPSEESNEMREEYVRMKEEAEEIEKEQPEFEEEEMANNEQSQMVMKLEEGDIKYIFGL